MGRVQDKVAFVSGGASGIGKAIVQRFVAEGATVVFGDIDEAGGAELAAATGATFVTQDVTSEQSWIDAMTMIKRKWGRLDCTVNNAGISGAGSLETMAVDAWDRLFAINVRGVMLGCKHSAALMQQNPGGSSGSIINMSSNTGMLGLAADCGYSASKGAVRLMTKSLGVDFARRGLNIRCNSIHPGPIDTPMLQATKATPAIAEALLNMTPMHRNGRPEEVAAMALFLASDESQFSTGSEFLVDGGSTAGLQGL